MVVNVPSDFIRGAEMKAYVLIKIHAGEVNEVVKSLR